MANARDFFRPIPIESPIHSMAAETKIVAGVLISLGLVFNPQWSHVLVAAALAAIVFKLSRLPLSIIPKMPELMFFALLGGAMGSAMSGEDPTVFGLGIGSLLDYIRLISIGILMILWTGILGWTTGLNAIGFAVRRLLSPLRFIGVPIDEIGTVIALAIRSLPLVADEVDVVSETVNSRPPDMEHEDKIFKQAMAYIADTTLTIVVGTHRRARDLATAMVSRGSHQAPRPPKASLTIVDKSVIFFSMATCVLAFVIPGWPAPTP